MDQHYHADDVQLQPSRLATQNMLLLLFFHRQERATLTHALYELLLQTSTLCSSVLSMHARMRVSFATRLHGDL